MTSTWQTHPWVTERSGRLPLPAGVKRNICPLPSERADSAGARRAERRETWSDSASLSFAARGSKLLENARTALGSASMATAPDKSTPDAIPGRLLLLFATAIITPIGARPLTITLPATCLPDRKARLSRLAHCAGEA